MASFGVTSQAEAISNKMGIGTLNPKVARRAVFLDRDGVLNRAVVRNGRPYPPSNLTELEIIPGAAESLRELKRRGFLLIVVTNQPDVARGTQSRETVREIHARMAELLPVDEFRACYHDDQDSCACRKPKPGLLVQAGQEHGIELKTSYLIGDRWRDVEAGQAVGCRTIFIDYRYQERGPAVEPDARVSDLNEAVQWIIGQEEARGNADEVRCRSESEVVRRRR
jgi:D-glycero-D-manno-heptose 1,7-bisphosphate phosphatase